MKREDVISVCSLKGGVGRSLVSASLALALARRGLRVLLVDLDPYTHTLDLFLGLEDRRLFGLSDILLGRPPEKTLLCREEIPRLFLCPASDSPFLPDEEALSRFLLLIGERVQVDKVILDLPPSAEKERWFAPLSARHLVVSTQNPASLLAAAKTAESLSLTEGDGAWLLLNRFDLADLSSYSGGRMCAREMIDLVGLALIGIVPEAYDLSRRSEEGTLWRHEKEIDRPFDNVAARLLGEERLLFDGMKEGKKTRRSL
ncbi:MAG: P-loop NTPase [Clostridia bacterium]|nr:P-loop NTPase [Clostridia bacterium]